MNTTLASYFGHLGYKSWLRGQLPPLRFFVVFFRPSKRMLRWWLKICHGCFLPCQFQAVICKSFCSSTPHTYAVENVPLNTLASQFDAVYHTSNILINVQKCYVTVEVEFLPIMRAVTVFIPVICFVQHSYLINHKFLHENKVDSYLQKPAP